MFEMNRRLNIEVNNIKGAPFKIGDIVKVQRIVDCAGNRRFLKAVGTVVYFDYECGCGQSYPADPMIGVRFQKANAREEFWREELKLVRRGAQI